MASIAAAPTLRMDAQTVGHPRLFLDAQQAARLRELIGTTHAELWKAVRQQADTFAAQKPAAYRDDADPNDEQLWQREVGNTLPFLGIAHLLTGETRYLDSATRWSLASCSYPTWGKGIRNGVDLAAGHQLLGLALVYDWLYDSLPADARDQIRKTLIARGGVMFAAARGTIYWRNSYLQNHLWVNMCGLAAAGLALRGEFDSGPWLNLAREKFQRTEDSLGPDGASHDGVGYWSYGIEYLLKYWHLAGDAFGERPSSSWWNQTAAYRLYMALPHDSWSATDTNVDIADCPRRDWYGPDYLLRRLAALNRDPQAQWLAGELDRAKLTVYSARWLNLLWYDPSVEERPPNELPTMRHFEDMGLVSARSGWDGGESLLVFKCGPPLGHDAVDKFDYDAGSGHVHPDVNHFVLFANGEWLLRDDGYAWKQTNHHNTLLVDGVGQIGEGSQWYNGMDAIRAKARPRVLYALSGPVITEIIGDATSMYPRASGVRRYVRRLLFYKPDVLIVVDEIETDTPRHLELRFHPEFPCVLDEHGSLIARGRKTIMRIDLLTPDDARIRFGPTAGKDRDGKPMLLHTVQVETTRSKWQNIMVFSWSAIDSLPARVTLDRRGASRPAGTADRRETFRFFH
jgi:hypothetical protein